MYLISSCLVGINCRYNGTSARHADLMQMIEDGEAVAVCPELLVGLPTPRETCEIQKDPNTFAVISKSGKDYTQLFHQAAIETLEICERHKISRAILQSRSPSCGYGKVYDGHFSGDLISGNGLTADWLSKNGVDVCNEEDWAKR